MRSSPLTSNAQPSQCAHPDPRPHTQGLARPSAHRRALTHTPTPARTRPGRMRQLVSVLVLTLVMGAVLTGCIFEAIKPYNSPYTASEEQNIVSPELKALRMQVVGDENADIDLAATYLRGTQLFQSVTTDVNSDAELRATVSVANGGIRCGNPQLLTYLTLGLMPSSNLYRAGLILSISATGHPEPVTLEVFHSAPAAFGLLALPMRLSPRWEKPLGADPSHFSTALRDALLDREADLLAQPPAAAR